MQSYVSHNRLLLLLLLLNKRMVIVMRDSNSRCEGTTTKDTHADSAVRQSGKAGIE